MTIFEVLANPSRRRILELLLEGERPVGELVEAMELSQPGVSRNLRVLREAGVVEARTDAQRRLYRLRPEAFRELDAWLEPYRLLWSGRLDALERRLEEMAEGEATTEEMDTTVGEETTEAQETAGDRESKDATGANGNREREASDDDD